MWRRAVVVVVAIVAWDAGGVSVGLLGGSPPARAEVPDDLGIDDVPFTPPDPFHPVPPPQPERRPGEHLPLGWAPPSDVVVRYEPPVAGEVMRPFQRPSSEFGQGHRGVDLAATPGTPVSAAASGYVHHAGAVGQLVWVSIGHGDGILTSYGPLRDLEVRRGEQVVRGQRLGVLAPGGHGDDRRDQGLHWGARRGLTYLDPLGLLDPGTARPSLVGAGAWRGIDHVVTPYDPWEGSRWGGLRLAASPEAETPGFSVPPSPNHLVMVAGLGSRSSHVPIDPADLGYPDRSVTFFSYAGRYDPEDLDLDDPRRDQLPYDHRDTWESIEVAAHRLEAQLREQRRREPGRGVDLIGHSQGGVVITYYLTHLHDPYDPTLPTIGRVVTVATPHQGSYFATTARLVRAQPVLGAGVELVRGIIPAGGGTTARDQIDLEAPVLDQLAPNSGFVRDYSLAWHDALREGPAGPLAMGTEVLTIHGGTDVVVHSDSAHLRDDIVWPQELEPDRFPGYDVDDVTQSTSLPGGHSGVLETEAVREATWRFLAGQEPTTAGRPLISTLTDEVALATTVASAATFVYGGFVTAAGRELHRYFAVTDDLDRVVDERRDSDTAQPQWTERGDSR